jgi:hypothetical protein
LKLPDRYQATRALSGGRLTSAVWNAGDCERRQLHGHQFVDVLEDQQIGVQANDTGERQFQLR